MSNNALSKKREELRNARIEKKLTQKSLAEKVDVTVDHIKSLEYGRVNPSIPLMFKICSVLGKSPEELFGDVIQHTH